MRRGHGSNVPEFCDEHGAAILAARIAAYWAERGRTVTTRIERVTQTDSTAYCGMFAVRSDLTFQLPPKAAGAPAHPGSTTTT